MKEELLEHDGMKWFLNLPHLRSQCPCKQFSFKDTGSGLHNPK